MSALSRQKRNTRRAKAFAAQLERFGEEYTVAGRTILGVPLPDEVEHELEPGGFRRAAGQAHTVSFAREAFSSTDTPEGIEVTDIDGHRYTIAAFTTEPGDPELRARLQPVPS